MTVMVIMMVMTTMMITMSVTDDDGAIPQSQRSLLRG